MPQAATTLICLYFLLGTVITATPRSSQSSARVTAVPILVYHRLGPVRADSMTVTTEHFKEQISLLRENGFSIIPLADLVAWRTGKGPDPPPRSVVLTFDDGHASVYREARCIIANDRIPVTLFIYPSCISRTSYAMTWEELSDLAATPYFAIQSHTFWHPNFKQDSKKLDQAAYATFVDMQLRRSKTILEEKLKRPVDFLAWPFGIYDSYLMNRARAIGYEAGFSIECRAATASDPLLALPRCLVSDDDVGSRFLRLINSAIRSAKN